MVSPERASLESGGACEHGWLLDPARCAGLVLRADFLRATTQEL